MGRGVILSWENLHKTCQSVALRKQAAPTGDPGLESRDPQGAQQPNCELLFNRSRGREAEETTVKSAGIPRQAHILTEGEAALQAPFGASVARVCAGVHAHAHARTRTFIL